jgi:DNA-binding transcriptional LysR family regulator
VLTDRNLDLIEDGFDVAIGFGKMAESRLVARRVGEVRRILVASPDYIARKGNPRQPTDLHRHEIVYCSALAAPLEWRFRKKGRDQVVRLAPQLMINDMEGAVLAVKAGRGIGRHLTYQVFDELKSGALVQVLPKFEAPAFPIQLAFASARHLPLHARAFLDHSAHELSVLPVMHQ